MRVCVISSYPPQPSGIGTYSSYLVKSLSKSAVVEVLSWNHQGFLSRLFGPVSRFFELRSSLGKNDIVHVQYHLGDMQVLFLPVLWVARVRTRAKVVLTLHEDYLNLWFSFAVTVFHNIFYHAADALILHTLDQGKVLSNCLLGISTVIPHGVIYRRLKTIRDDKTIIIPGFINYWKGHDIMIDAMPYVLKSCPNARLVIFGKMHDKAYAGHIRDMVESLGLSDKVVLNCDYMPEPKFFQMFMTCCMAVLPYRRITMSGVLCHIISWNVPSVVSNLPVFREFTRGKASYFEPESEIDLAKKVVLLLRSKRLRRTMTADFSCLAKAYSWDSVAKETIALYRKI